MANANPLGTQAPSVVRDFNASSDFDDLRARVVAIQDFERGLDSRMPPGEEVAEAYLGRILERCRESNGKIFVVDFGGPIGGFACVLTRVKAADSDAGPTEYGLVSHLIVLEEFRGHGYGRKLLVMAEAYALSEGVRWLRIEVLASNVVARGLYLDGGFKEYGLELEKDLQYP